MAQKQTIILLFITVSKQYRPKDFPFSQKKCTTVVKSISPLLFPFWYCDLYFPFFLLA